MEDCQNDIKKFKIKEAMVYKQSRFLKQWRERWVVLTENRIYSFQKKQVYKNPTQVLPLEEVQTVKIYHKAQIDRKHTIRIESKPLNFYMSFNNTQQKWSWLSAIERMISKKQGDIQVSKQINQAISRNTFISRESVKSTDSIIKGPSTEPDLNSILGISQAPVQVDFSKKKKSNLGLHKMEPIKLAIKVEAPKPENIPKSSPTVEKKQPVVQKKPEVIVKTVQSPPQIIEKIVEKIQYVDKIVYIEKKTQPTAIATTPSTVSSTTSTDKAGAINKLFDDILVSEEDYRKFIIFIVDLATCQPLGYGDVIVQVCLKHKNSRFFSEAFLQLLNRETDDQTLNLFLKFVVLVYDKTEQYFYQTDVKVLIDILIRQMELYRSELNHFLILLALKALCTSSSWSNLENYRVDDMKSLIDEIQKTSPSKQNQNVAHELLTYL